jgi:hypothetical protein
MLVAASACDRRALKRALRSASTFKNGTNPPPAEMRGTSLDTARKQKQKQQKKTKIARVTVEGSARALHG